nr:XRE family transcriptional regulator [Lachnospiraceae bacterium]
MTYAYGEIYVLKAQEAMGSMLHYAVYDLKMEIAAFFREFISSGIAHRFGMGEPKYIVGMSGIEIAREVCSITRGTEPDVEPAVFYGRTAEYWAGWALAYYEWCRNMDFRRINDAVPITEIVEMYDPYHEADITRFVDEIDRRISERNRVTCLAR